MAMGIIEWLSSRIQAIVSDHKCSIGVCAQVVQNLIPLMAPVADADVFEAGGENSYVREGYTKVAAETRQLMNNFKWARRFLGLIQHGSVNL